MISVHSGLKSNMRSLPANAHIHLPPNFSAFDSVEQAVSLAAEQGLRDALFSLGRIAYTLQFGEPDAH